MTNPNPFDTNSPFIGDQQQSGDIKNQPESQNKEFEIRTMHDDLENFKKQPKPPIDTPPTEPTQKKEAPVAAQTNKNETSSQANAATTPFHKPEEKPTTQNNVQTSLPKEKLLQQPEIKIKEITESANSKSGSSLKIVASVLAVLFVAVLALGGYYYWMTKTEQVTIQTPTSPQPTEQTTPEPTPTPQPEEILPPAQSEQKYSFDTPNYLVLDLAVMSSDDIKATLEKISNEIAQSTNNGPYEFIVVDANNNPVAFPIFATASKLTLSPNILSNLDIDFSLYFYNDAGNIRMALESKIKNKDEITKELTKEEPTLISDASILFLNNTPEIKKGSFNNGSYKNYAVRYLNLNSANNLSVDYTTDEPHLYIGTSKNTLRAVLDKSSQPSQL